MLHKFLEIAAPGSNLSYKSQILSMSKYRGIVTILSFNVLDSDGKMTQTLSRARVSVDSSESKKSSCGEEKKSLSPCHNPQLIQEGGFKL